jgi:hypothetical protein
MNGLDLTYPTKFAQWIAGSGNSKTTKSKKKNRRRKEQNKDSSTADVYHTEKKVIIQ